MLLEHEHPFASPRERQRRRQPTRTRTDHDRIEVRHLNLRASARYNGRYNPATIVLFRPGQARQHALEDAPDKAPTCCDPPLLLTTLIALAGTGFLLASPSTALQLIARIERGASGLSLHQVEAANHQIVYLRGGTGEPLMLLHGFNADKDNWTRMARHIHGFDVVIPDLPGAGDSERKDGASYDIAAQVERLVALQDRLKLGPVHLAGNSMGGHIASAFAATHPERVHRLVLIAPAGVTPPNPPKLTARLAAGENPLTPSNTEEFDELLAFVFEHPPFLPWPIKDHFAQRAIDNQVFAARQWKDLGRKPFPLEPVLPSITAKTLVLWGDHDRVLDPSGATVFEGLVPEAVVEILPACGHAPMLEYPQLVGERMVEFLRR